MAFSLSPPWIHRLAQITRTPVALQFYRAARSPRRAQLRRLRALLASNQNTEYGLRHQFSSIQTFDDYRRQVPLIGAADLAPWITRMQQGERRLLTEEAPLFYGRSTGTTGKPKDIPINATYRADFQRSVLISMWFVYWQVPDAFQHKLLYFVSPRTEGRTADGVEFGAISGYNFTEMPEQVRSVYAWPYELIEVSDIETRWYLSLHIAAYEKISIIAGIFPVGILMMLRALERYAPQLAEHIEAGTFPDWLKLTETQRAFFSKYAIASTEVARRVREAVGASPAEQVARVFPELRLVLCWTSASAQLYVPELQDRLGPGVQIRDAVFAATEGWCNAPLGEPVSGGPLTLTGHVYEFLEESIVDAVGGDLSQLQRTPTKLVDELELGKRYYIILSTSAGLYRYFLADLLEVYGYWGKVPKVRFVRKLGSFSNLAGEKMEEIHVTQGIGAALASVDRSAVWFSMMPVADHQPGYDLYIEFRDDDADPRRLQDFADRAHRCLCEQNEDWKTFHHDGTLSALRVCQVRRGAVDRALAVWETQGRSLGQVKLSHLVTDPARLPCDLKADVFQTCRASLG